MAISGYVMRRLWNWKFEQARFYVDAEIATAAAAGQPNPYTDDEHETISALAALLGNSGHAAGDGVLGPVIRAAVAWVICQPVGAPEDWSPDVVRSPATRADEESRAHHPSTGIYSVTGTSGNRT